MTSRVELSPAEAGEVRAGRWVRVDLGRWFQAGTEAGAPAGSPLLRTRSALVGRTRGKTRAWANVCRHQPLSLDVTADPLELAPGVRAAPMDDGRVHLMCHSHGALFRVADGVCVTGPCQGEALIPVNVEESAGGAIALVLP